MESFNLFNMLGEDEDSSAEEAMGIAAGIGATKKVASKKPSSKKQPEPTPPASEKKSKTASEKKTTSPKKSAEKPSPKKAPPAVSKKSDYAKSLGTVDEWSEGPTKKLTSLEPTVPEVVPEAPTVNTAPTQKVATEAIQKAEEIAPSVSPVKEAAEAIETSVPVKPSTVAAEAAEVAETAAEAATRPKYLPATIAKETTESPSFYKKLVDLARTSGQAALKKIGLSETAIASIMERAAPVAKGAGRLAGPVGLAMTAWDVISPVEANQGADKPIGPPLTTEEMDATMWHDPSKPFYPTRRGEPIPEMDQRYLNQLYPKDTSDPERISSSKIDTEQQILEDINRLSEDQSGEDLASLVAAQEKEALAPSARTVSAGEPRRKDVDRLAKKAMLAPIVGEKLAEELSLTDRFNEQLLRARESQNLGRLGAGLGEAAQRLGAAIAGVEPGDVSPWRRMGEASESRPKEFKEDFEATQEVQERDPKSPISKRARDFLTEMKIPHSENSSYYEIQKALPQIALILKARETTAARAQAIREASEEKEKTKEEKTQLNLENKIESLYNRANTGKFAELKGSIQKAERGIRLLENPTPTGQTDLASFFAFMKVVQQDESVVREAEARLGMSLGSFAEKIRAITSKPFTGALFTPKQRSAMADTLKIVKSQMVQDYRDNVEPEFKRIAKLPGATPERLAQLEEEFFPKYMNEPSSSSSVDKVIQLSPAVQERHKPGDVLVLKGGARYRISKDGKTAEAL